MLYYFITTTNLLAKFHICHVSFPFLFFLAFSCHSKLAKMEPSGSLTKQLEEEELHLGNPVLIRIFKAERRLELWMQKETHFPYTLVQKYPICSYGTKGLGPKFKEGDGRAPEGIYEVRKSQLNPKSKYHLAFNLGYPNAYDRAHRRRGSYLMVHGDCVSIGCYAMTDTAIEEIYGAVAAALSAEQSSVQVHCYPFALESAALEKHKDSPYFDFWSNLADAYQLFEEQKQPLVWEVQQKRYVFLP